MTIDDEDVFSLPPSGPPPLPRSVADERRNWLRAPYLTPASVLVGERGIEGRTRDISEGGLQLHVREKLEKGTTVVVRFAPPLSIVAISVRGTVQWARELERGYGVGISFQSIPDEVRAIISGYAGLAPVV